MGLKREQGMIEKILGWVVFIVIIYAIVQLFFGNLRPPQEYVRCDNGSLVSIDIGCY